MKPQDFAIEVVKTLQTSGFQALWAGGCVRDQLLSRKPKDYDVATSALPDQVREVFGFKRTLAIGASFGVITVLGPKSAGQIEVATFRKDGGYSDGRRPDSVEFTDAREDALRRDFTINGMFFDPVKAEVLDYVQGYDDLQAELIRAIGNPHERINEDKLRMLRGIRFASTFQFVIEPETMAAIEKHSHEIDSVSGERIGAEIRRMLEDVNRIKAVELLRKSKLIQYVIPGAGLLFEDDEEGWSERIDRLSRLKMNDFCAAAAILLDPLCRKYGLERVNNRWKLSNDEREAIAWIVENFTKLPSAHEVAWSEVQPLFLNPNIERAIRVAEACYGNSAGLSFCRARLYWPTEKLNPPPLINGGDLIQMGVEKGPKFKIILDRVRRAQLDGKIVSPDQARDLVFKSE
ncbi:MAG: CCA tRNA nucleotidyltransferase [Planctomycetota bacterium]